MLSGVLFFSVKPGRRNPVDLFKLPGKIVHIRKTCFQSAPAYRKFGGSQQMYRFRNTQMQLILQRGRAGCQTEITLQRGAAHVSDFAQSVYGNIFAVVPVQIGKHLFHFQIIILTAVYVFGEFLVGWKLNHDQYYRLSCNVLGMGSAGNITDMPPFQFEVRFTDVEHNIMSDIFDVGNVHRQDKEFFFRTPQNTKGEIILVFRLHTKGAVRFRDLKIEEAVPVKAAPGKYTIELPLI